MDSSTARPYNGLSSYLQAIHQSIYNRQGTDLLSTTISARDLVARG